MYCVPKCVCEYEHKRVVPSCINGDQVTCLPKFRGSKCLVLVCVHACFFYLQVHTYASIYILLCDSMYVALPLCTHSTGDATRIQ